MANGISFSGFFWRRTTSVAALTVLLAGIPIGIVTAILLGAIPLADYCPQLQGFVPILPTHVIDAYSLGQFLRRSGYLSDSVFGGYGCGELANRSTSFQSGGITHVEQKHDPVAERRASEAVLSNGRFSGGSCL